MTDARSRMLHIALWIVLCVGIVIEAMALPRSLSVFASGQQASLGAELEPTETLSRVWRVTAVTPDGGFARAGFQPGDLVRWADLTRRGWAPGETVQFDRRDKDGSWTRQAIELGSSPVTSTVLSGAASVFSFMPLFCIFIAAALRRVRDRSQHVLLLGLALNSVFPGQSFFADQTAREVTAFYFNIAAGIGYWLYAWFGLRGSRSPRVARAIAVALAAAGLIVMPFRILGEFGAPSIIGYFGMLPYVAVSYGIVLASLWRQQRDMSGAQRQRTRWLLLGFALLLVADLGGWMPEWLMLAWPGLPWIATVLLPLGALAMLYGALRHRVFDFGFAVNRATVFAGTSLALVGLFAALTALADRLLHLDQSGERNWVDIAITFALAIAAARVRQFVERWVERLLFREWRAREQALEAFVVRAAHHVRVETLLDGFREALRSFAGAEARIYLADDDGTFHLAAGTSAPAALDVDDPLLVELRAEPRAVVLSGADAALALPMAHGGSLFGVVQLGARANGELYRPDEVALLARAVRQVGLDLELLQAKQRRDTPLAALRAQLDRIEAGLATEFRPRSAS